MWFQCSCKETYCNFRSLSVSVLTQGAPCFQVLSLKDVTVLSTKTCVDQICSKWISQSLKIILPAEQVDLLDLKSTFLRVCFCVSFLLIAACLLLPVFSYLSIRSIEPYAIASVCLPVCLVQMEQHDKGTGANPFPPCHLQAFRSATVLFHLD